MSCRLNLLFRHSPDNPRNSVDTGIRTESAVSPVVGIMLMLTITLILAAIISGMTGGIAQSQKKPPQLLFESTIVNNGTISEGSFFDIRIVSVSESIPTHELKIQTEWANSTRTQIRTITPGSVQPGVFLGFGPGINKEADFGNYFGNYTLMGGTRLHANGSTVSSGTNGMNATLSDDWLNLTEGTPVRIQFVHVPSGSIIADKTITVEV